MGDPRAERTDLAVLLATSAIVPVVWVLAFGFRGGASVVEGDGVSVFALWFREHAQAGGDALARYRPGLAGGMELYATLGVSPLQRVAALLRLGPFAAMAFTAFGAQVLYGVLGARAAADLARGWTAAKVQDGVVTRVVVATLLAFVPSVCGRITIGHLNLVLGFLTLPALLAVVAAGRARATVTLAVTASFALANALSCSGEQAVVVSVLFGTPLLLVVALVVAARGGARGLASDLAWTALVALLGAAFAAPELYAIVAHARSTDAARSLSDVVTYDLGALRPGDLASAVPWTAGLHGEAPPGWGESFAVGPLVLFAALAPRREGLRLAAAVGLSALAAIALATRAEPFASLLLRALPVLAAFRVPWRALVPIALALPTLGCAGLMALPAPERTHLRFAVYAVVLGVCGALLPPAGREGVAWALAGTMTATALWLRARRSTLPLASCVIAGALLPIALRAVGQRLLPFIPSAVLAEADARGDHVRAAAPALGEPLARVHVRGVHAPFFQNEAFAMGLGAAEGYAYPQRRFVALVCALRGERFRPTLSYFDFASTAPELTALRVLYDVRADVSFDEDPSGTPLPAPPVAGAAWFSARTERVSSFEDLAARLHDAGHDSDVIAGTALVVESDPRAGPLVALVAHAGGADACAQARVEGFESLDHGQRFRASVTSPASCPLTIATNYAETFTARATLESGETVTAATVPSYGALLGVVVPAGARAIEVSLAPIPWAVTLVRWLAVLGWGVLAALGWRGARAR